MRRLIAALGLSLLLAGATPAWTQLADPTPAGATAPAPAEPHALDGIVERAALFQSGPDDLLNAPAQPGFRWVSNAHDVMESRRPGTTLFNLPVYDTLARFSGEKLSEMTILFYDRGDAGELTQDKFQELLRTSVKALTEFTKQQPKVRGKDAASAVKAEGVEWQTDSTRFLLEYSFTREIKERSVPFRAEFVRLKIAPVERPQSMLAAALATPAERFSGPDHVKKEKNGDVFIDGIPMVDQGKKGYCVVASTERLLRYYGGKADEHELAEIANTSATQGTSNEAMVDSLKKLSARLHIKTRVIEPFDVKQVLATINEYNRIARRGKKTKEIDLSSHILDVGQIYSQMDPAVLREARTKNKSDLDRFQRLVQAHIDDGIPLLWAVLLGILPEQNIPTGMAAGHMRLIIGYNSRTNEILYSDPWGPGHELTRMSAADAWTITTSLSTVEPL